MSNIHTFIEMVLGTNVGKLYTIIEAFLKSKKQVHICALGEKQTGKTLWLTYLRTGKIPKEYKETGVSDFEAFDLNLDEDRTVHIDSGTDIGGEKSNRKEFHKDWVEKSDIICYFVNITKFLSNNAYRKEVKGGIDLVADLLKDSKRRRKKMPFIILSYADELVKNSNYKTEVQGEVAFKSHFNDNKFKLFMQNTLLTDLTNPKRQKEIKNKIFKTFSYVNK